MSKRPFNREADRLVSSVGLALVGALAGVTDLDDLFTWTLPGGRSTMPSDAEDVLWRALDTWNRLEETVGPVMAREWFLDGGLERLRGVGPGPAATSAGSAALVVGWARWITDPVWAVDQFGPTNAAMMAGLDAPSDTLRWLTREPQISPPVEDRLRFARWIWACLEDLDHVDPIREWYFAPHPRVVGGQPAIGIGHDRFTSVLAAVISQVRSQEGRDGVVATIEAALHADHAVVRTAAVDAAIEFGIELRWHDD